MSYNISSAITTGPLKVKREGDTDLMCSWDNLQCLILKMYVVWNIEWLPSV